MTAWLAIRAFLGKLPWQAYALMAAIGIVLLAYSKGYSDARAKYRRQMAELVNEVETAQAEARARQIAVNQAEQARLDALAERIDREHEATRIAVADATAAFIARNRVRQDRQCVASGTDSPATGDDTGVPESLPANVIVAEADVRACADLYAYAVNAREWAIGLAGASQ